QGAEGCGWFGRPRRRRRPEDRNQGAQVTCKRPEQPVTGNGRGETSGAKANGAAANGAPGAEAEAGDVIVKDNISLNQQIFRFILTGGLSAIVDLGSTLFLRFVVGMTDSGSKAIGFVLGTLTAYMINRRWTFNAAPSTKRFVITMVTYALTFAVQVGLYKLCIPWLEGMELSPLVVRLISFVIAQGTATVLNFLIQRFVIFRN